MIFRWLLLAILLACPLGAQAAPPALDHASRADGVHVIPDRFLRAWDPLTVFFDRDTGPAAGGPEDQPQRLVTLAPATPGAWQWLGRRVLQFRPVERWQPLRRVTVAIGGQTTTLVPLLPTPVATGPADADAGIAGLDRLALTFPSPVDRDALARLLTIELRPQPGLSSDAARDQILTKGDFDLIPVERATRGDAETVVVALHRAVPDGKVAILRLRLSDAPGLDAPSFEARLKTAVPFAFADITCDTGSNSTAVDGLRLCAPADAGAKRGLTLNFTASPEALDIVRARDILHVTPHLADLSATADGNSLHIGGAFLSGTAYTLEIPAGALHDSRGRALTTRLAARFAFGASPPTLRWDASQGIVERFGPQMVPLRGQGFASADLRIHPIDATSRDFWPYPVEGVTTRDDTPPPLPGHEPQAWDQPGPIGPADMAARLQALGSPSVSTLVPLPLQPGATARKFGLDVAPLLAKIAGTGQPGTYLLGLRPIGALERHWVRVQVTDLVLTAVEAPESVRFVVTSLSTARPVAGAAIALEQVQGDALATVLRGTTASDGSLTWNPGRHRQGSGLARILVTRGADTLVLDPSHGPQLYTAGGWSRGTADWLGWAARGAVQAREAPPRLLCHVYSERPIYRPEEPVLLAGMIRRWNHGALALASGSGTVLITGPDKQEWRLPARLDDAGGFHVAFDTKTVATGDYAVEYQPGEPAPGCGEMTFKKEAYRLPTFEVLLHGPSHASLDQPFDVSLLARWFAGGLVSDRPVAWRVTQYPYVWSPPGRDGFAFSSDSRFSGDAAFRSTAVLNREVKTDAGGSAHLALDPTIEPTAQPRDYVVEATVTGDDDIQVRSVQHVVALPPFALGIKFDRYIAHPGTITPQVLALDGDGHPVAGLKMSARLIRRNWNSVLQASDFASGAAKYDTQVIDETVTERSLVSTGDAQAVPFEVRESGVYILELSAADRAGRMQTVRVDSFVAGETPVTWSQPPAQTVTLSPDKPDYAPGEIATLVVQSPFQTARALAVIEQPEGPFTYAWTDIAHGYGRIAVPIRKTQMPSLAVHVLLMRGRLARVPADAAADPAAPFDQGKPVTLAASAALHVRPVDNMLRVGFDPPPNARPGQTIDLVLHLADGRGAPVPGEATVWLVDQAVLTLAPEQPLDPLPAFIVERPATMAARDTRNMAFGIIPLAEAPGGGAGNEKPGAENISVRRNFTPVPFYAPRVKIGADGTARLRVKLPDSLTVFMLRAKAVSGPDRFGAGTGQLRVRLPLVAQPVLPRFVRPGDSFVASIIGRLVEGDGGPGTANLSTTGLAVSGSREQPMTWDGGHPARVGFPVSVTAQEGTVRLDALLRRTRDGAGDAVQLDLPVRPDRPKLHERVVASIGVTTGGTMTGTLDIPALGEAARPGTYERSVTVAADPMLVRIVAGLQYLFEYPFGCTEQRIALAASELAFKPFGPIVEAAGVQGRIEQGTQAALAAIVQTTDEDGLVAYWPHGRGSVLLTAWSYDFWVQAQRAGMKVDPALGDRLRHVLEQALRSDYARLLDGEAVRERAAALSALADGGDLKPDYATELARRAVQLPTESLAGVIDAITRLPASAHALLPNLSDELWGRVQTRLRDGTLVYRGLTDSPADPLILPSEARSLSEVTRAAATLSPQDPRLALLRGGLLNIADADGWGSTNATAAALRALATSWQKPGEAVALSFTLPGLTQTGKPSGGPAQATLDAATPLVQQTTHTAGDIQIVAKGGTTPLATLVDTTYLPAAPGWSARATQHGFVLGRRLFRVPQSGPMQLLAPAADGAIHLAVGDVVEEVDDLVNPADRTNVALRLPLAAGLEPLNPNLATSPAEAAPSAAPTAPPDYAAYGDDEVLAVYTTLPKGNFTLRTRMRAMIEGLFTAPPAQVETLYQKGVAGSSDGLRIAVQK